MMRALLLFAVVGLAGCSAFTASTMSVSGGDTVVTGADVRTVNRVAVEQSGSAGRIRPKYLTCAEPSPDVAKAFASAFGFGTSVAVKGLPSGVSPEVAIAISRSQAESLAQLGERLATIQLLRDGLYRACEAYANGAISETTYAVLLSRYDDTMITMLLGELAAGAFGRSLAALGTSADSRSSAALDLAAKQDASRKAETEAAAARREADQAKVDKAEKGATQEAERRSAEADRSLADALRAEAVSAAKALAVTAAGGLTVTRDPGVAQVLHEMQRKYIENINSSALEALPRAAKRLRPAPRLAVGARVLLPVPSPRHRPHGP